MIHIYISKLIKWKLINLNIEIQCPRFDRKHLWFSNFLVKITAKVLRNITEIHAWRYGSKV